MSWMGRGKVFVFVLACIFIQVAQANIFKQHDKIIFYGDSNTAWGSYPKHIEEYFSLNYPQLDLEFINAGQAGDCISLGYYSRFESDVLALKPQVLFIMYGINDLNWGRDLSPEAFKIFNEHVSLTVKSALLAGIRDVYILSYPVTDYPLSGSDPELCSQIPFVSEKEDSLLQKLGDSSIAVAKETCFESHCGIGLDIERPMRNLLPHFRKRNLRLHHIDGVHLNENGNKVLAYLILKSLSKLSH